jgi:hypothetical protein
VWLFASCVRVFVDQFVTKKGRVGRMFVCLCGCMKSIACFFALVILCLLSACQSTPDSSYANNPTDSGSRFSYYSLPSSRMAEQNVDLDD